MSPGVSPRVCLPGVSPPCVSPPVSNSPLLTSASSPRLLARSASLQLASLRPWRVRRIWRICFFFVLFFLPLARRFVTVNSRLVTPETRCLGRTDGPSANAAAGPGRVPDRRRARRRGGRGAGGGGGGELPLKAPGQSRRLSAPIPQDYKPPRRRDHSPFSSPLRLRKSCVVAFIHLSAVLSVGPGRKARWRLERSASAAAPTEGCFFIIVRLQTDAA